MNKVREKEKSVKLYFVLLVLLLDVIDRRLFCSVSSNGRYCGSAGACEMGEGISLLAEKVGINVLYFEYFQVLNTFIKFLGEQKLGCYSRSFIW
jgi:hypothetical protein